MGKGCKIFCIGQNKTGTTSIRKAFEDLGFDVGNQRVAENLLINYLENDFESIIDYCKTANVFQDFPFSWPETYKHLDKAFPNSKFILSVRDSAEQWYQSLVKFHSKKFGETNGKPSKKDLMNSNYIFKGRPWLTHKALFGITDENTYDKDILINHYHTYNSEVKEYFKNRNDLLIINIAEESSYKLFCDFIEAEPKYSKFPWENQTAKL
ncbi:sulfotransferase [Gracilibacillus thailandensis]|uniref:Sulfotransferase family protein n=1 Tax=Gracilibacillus thailandensis TaxID=563735 RepID=A0A6N7QY91_9BACI|nr:sulfotransferase [Gracilibacillus thailandensis]MRI67028.1 hypothetical protein [Gracilibacillus thailandensis]